MTISQKALGVLKHSSWCLTFNRETSKQPNKRAKFIKKRKKGKQSFLEANLFCNIQQGLLRLLIFFAVLLRRGLLTSQWWSIGNRGDPACLGSSHWLGQLRPLRLQRKIPEPQALLPPGGQNREQSTKKSFK